MGYWLAAQTPADTIPVQVGERVRGVLAEQGVTRPPGTATPHMSSVHH